MIYMLIIILCIVSISLIISLSLAYQYIQLKTQSNSLNQQYQQLEVTLRNELKQNREESNLGSTTLQDSILKTLTSISTVQNKQLEMVTNQLNTVMQAHEKRIQE